MITILLTITILSSASCGFSDNHYIAKPETSSFKKPSQNDRMSQPSYIANQLAKTSSSRAYYRDKVMVLMYHNVKVRSNRASIITLKKFSEQLSAIKMNGFQIITMDQY